MEQPKSPIINFAGPSVALGPLQHTLRPLYNRWNNDFHVNTTTRSLRPVALAEGADTFDKLVTDKSYVFFTIYERATNQPIGYTYLSNIQDETAEFSIVIGETSKHGQGFGTETTQLMLDYAFTILNLHNVMLKLISFNTAGHHAYQKAGFKEIGRRREAKRLAGKRWDLIYMDCLASEFKSPFLLSRLGETHDIFRETSA